MSFTTAQEILSLWAKNETSEARRERLEIKALRRDLETAQEGIQEAIARYRKVKLRARSKKQANSPDVFAELDAYSSQEDIRTAYGYEMISESEMDRLMNLWELREQSKQAEGPYRDRCVEMLELASQAVWDAYSAPILAYEEKVSQMHRDAERIAAENRRRNTERAR